LPDDYELRTQVQWRIVLHNDGNAHHYLNIAVFGLKEFFEFNHSEKSGRGSVENRSLRIIFPQDQVCHSFSIRADGLNYHADRFFRARGNLFAIKISDLRDLRLKDGVGVIILGFIERAALQASNFGTKVYSFDHRFQFLFSHIIDIEIFPPDVRPWLQILIQASSTLIFQWKKLYNIDFKSIPSVAIANWQADTTTGRVFCSIGNTGKAEIRGGTLIIHSLCPLLHVRLLRFLLRFIRL
jgi:hypothetical protein